MKNVLAIQSHVVYGFAGNKSATFPMQLLSSCTGKEPTPTPTEQPEEPKEKGGNLGELIMSEVKMLTAPVPNVPWQERPGLDTFFHQPLS